jgi:hypothetical protein
MTMKTTKDSSVASQLAFSEFSRSFLQDHAGLIMIDPKIAIVELVANCLDAGADRVDITWTEKCPGTIAIKDNGTGMTCDEFIERWSELSYNRRQTQGEEVDFPEDNRKSNRRAFGRNGKGRHSMFCFADEYSIKTWKNGQVNYFKVRRDSTGATPFSIAQVRSHARRGHGTLISAKLDWNYLPTSVVRDLIGTKFIADPACQIYLNGELVELTDLAHLWDTALVAIDGIGEILVHRVDSHKIGRTSKQHGVAWWVNKRLVGEPSWKGFDSDAYLDARTTEAKRYTFVVEADFLADQVELDWSHFRPSDKFDSVQAAAKTQVLKMLRQVMEGTNRSHKKAALEDNKQSLRGLPTASRYQVSAFIDEIQGQCPTMGQKELSAAVGVISKLEASRSGYALLEQLNRLNPDDLDALSALLERWTVHEAQIVLDELDRRLRVLDNMQRLLENPTTDELHQIQPLFEGALWVFGPEYESISFTSNRSLATVIREFFKDEVTVSLTPLKRPDFVILPDASIGVYSSESFDYRSEVDGISKVLIVELKRGGFEVGRKERQQALDYSNEMRRSGKIGTAASIVGFVLGTTIASNASDEMKEGSNTVIYPKTYSTIIQMANARTFKISEKLKKAQKERVEEDSLMEEVLNTGDQPTLEGIAA